MIDPTASVFLTQALLWGIVTGFFLVILRGSRPQR